MDLPYHIPVLRDAVVELMAPGPGKIFVDGTLGAGGHAGAVAAHLAPGGRMIGIDQDPAALAEAGRNLAEFGDIVTTVHARFDEIPQALDRLGIDKIDGALFDLGVSSHQLDTPERGFSFKDPSAILDMRMNTAHGGRTAADLLNTLDERALTTLIRDNSDEKWASRIARFVVERRAEEPYLTVGQLVETVHAAIPVAARPPDTHAATRTFQSLRIAVNNELSILGHALESTIDRLGKDGVIAVLSYHSLEDRIVKQLFTRLSGRGAGEGPYGLRPPAIVELVTKKPVTPSAGEISANPRARSAKLRVARRL
ncbi:MAG: 16S rRNA (cytosine(1402)-N(4))-methyltransferase RsmH [Capsulimonas sp.]|uniref:16S rRNA (cytosine(1402)-N(4))-methyltransferase RsmH n=1 Tax=Capsulimonas sp. TaxID=2494211 RepID=UPI003267848F